jgi:ABC-type sugar transport system permease subunit
MGFLPQCNSTLEDELSPSHPSNGRRKTTDNVSLVTEDKIWMNMTFHHLGLWLCVIFGAIAVVVSFFLIFMHATHYLKPWEQRHIIRILFMVPVYATVSFLSFLYYRHAIYFEVLRDCYEAFAIASFFTLLCHYVADDLHQQKNYFRTIRPRNWIWPLPWVQKVWGGKDGIWRTPRSGLTWFNVRSSFDTSRKYPSC